MFRVCCLLLIIFIIWLCFLSCWFVIFWFMVLFFVKRIFRWSLLFSNFFIFVEDFLLRFEGVVDVFFGGFCCDLYGNVFIVWVFLSGDLSLEGFLYRVIILKLLRGFVVFKGSRFKFCKERIFSVLFLVWVILGIGVMILLFRVLLFFL